MSNKFLELEQSDWSNALSALTDNTVLRVVPGGE